MSFELEIVDVVEEFGAVKSPGSLEITAGAHLLQCALSDCAVTLADRFPDLLILHYQDLTPGGMGGSGSGAAGDLCVATRAQSRHERPLRGREVAPIWAQKLHRTAHRLRAFDPEGHELAATQLVGNDHLRDEGDPKSRSDRALD